MPSSSATNRAFMPDPSAFVSPPPAAMASEVRPRAEAGPVRAPGRIVRVGHAVEAKGSGREAVLRAVGLASLLVAAVAWFVYMAGAVSGAGTPGIQAALLILAMGGAAVGCLTAAQGKPRSTDGSSALPCSATGRVASATRCCPTSPAGFRRFMTSACSCFIVHGVIVSSRYLLPTAVELAADADVLVPDLPPTA